MEILKTTVEMPGDTDTRCVLWGASPTEAAGHRKSFMKDYGPRLGRQHPDHQHPTAKGPLVAWLNANVRG